MTRFETAQITEAYRKRCEDRVAVINDGDRTVIVAANGAGGMGSGDLAAETVIRALTPPSNGQRTSTDRLPD